LQITIRIAKEYLFIKISSTTAVLKWVIDFLLKGANDILLGGIFDEYVLYIEADTPGTLKLRPLEAVMKDNYT
jgi:hypothetical protein